MLDQIKGKLIVSCQALPEEPLHSPFIMGRMALAAQTGGAAGIRAQGVEDIKEIMRTVDLPVIGILKKNYLDSEVFITATKMDVEALLETECQMIAMDATKRVRPNHEQLKDLLDLVHQNGRLAMADISTYEEAVEAERLGFDVISTTLCGYTSYSPNYEGPNLELIGQLVQDLHIPVIAEGKINNPEDLKAVLNAGAYSAVVGGAITRPQLITKKFVSILND